MKKVCLVIGAGAGIGGNVGKRFAAEGYHAVLCRRSDQYGLDRMVSEIRSSGGSAEGVLLNAVEPDAIEDLVARTEKNAGPIDTVIFNLGAQIGNRTLEQTTYKAFEQCWQIATFSLFRLAKSICPLMVERGGGNILVTSATAAVRGNAGQHAHATAVGGRHGGSRIQDQCNIAKVRCTEEVESTISFFITITVCEKEIHDIEK